MEITVNKDGQDLGPFTLDDLQAELASGNLTTEDFAYLKAAMTGYLSQMYLASMMSPLRLLMVFI